jgi:hypothetical protein
MATVTIRQAKMQFSKLIALAEAGGVTGLRPVLGQFYGGAPA